MLLSVAGLPGWNRWLAVPCKLSGSRLDLQLAIGFIWDFNWPLDVRWYKRP